MQLLCLVFTFVVGSRDFGYDGYAYDEDEDYRSPYGSIFKSDSDNRPKHRGRHRICTRGKDGKRVCYGEPDPGDLDEIPTPPGGNPYCLYFTDGTVRCIL